MVVEWEWESMENAVVANFLRWKIIQFKRKMLNSNVIQSSEWWKVLRMENKQPDFKSNKNIW